MSHAGYCFSPDASPVFSQSELMGFTYVEDAPQSPNLPETNTSEQSECIPDNEEPPSYEEVMQGRELRVYAQNFEFSHS